MEYYNPKTEERKSYTQLCNDLNASIPKDAKLVNGQWYMLVEGRRPIVDDTKTVVRGRIVRDGDIYIQQYIAKDLPADIIQRNRMQAAKSIRSSEVDQIKINLFGYEFDGDETSQARMSKVLAAYTATGRIHSGETIKWVTADNQIAELTLEQLGEILTEAINRQTEIWISPYKISEVEPE